MNPSVLLQKEPAQRRVTSKSKPPKKVLKLLDSISPSSEDLTTSLFLGDLSVICDEVQLYRLFIRFGGIESVQLKKSDRDHQRAHLGFGFIRFTTRESAERALQEMNGYFFLGRAMRVGWAVDYGKKQSPYSMEKTTDSKKRPIVQIHVMFVTRELNRRVSELDLGGVFSRYGNLVDIAIKKNAINNEHGVQSGYAFLHFALTPEGLKSAVTAVEEVNNLVVDNIAYQCKVTHKLQAQLLSLNCSEKESEVGMVNSPRPLSLVIPNSESPSQRMNFSRPSEMDFFPQQAFVYSDFYGKGFHSSDMDPTMIMGRTEQSLSPLPPGLDHHLNPFETQTNAFPPSFKKISNQNFTVNSNNNQTSTSHDHYHRHFVAGSLPLSSSFISSVNEDQLQRRNNNINMMTHPYDTFYQPQNHYHRNNNGNSYDDVPRF